MTMEGGEPRIDRAALALLVGHETRRSIIDALRHKGPLSAPELKSALGDPDVRLGHVAYHLTVLVSEEVLAAVGERPAGASVEKVYFFAVAA
jgi:hypothetical protein